MGLEYALYKRSPRERFDLGKARLGYAPGFEPSEQELLARLAALQTVRLVNASTEEISKRYAEFMKVTDPGHTAMWSIMDTPNSSAFKLSRWGRDELADKLYHAMPLNRDESEVFADRLLAWAGEDDVSLIVDNDKETLKRLGWSTNGYKEVGTIYV